MPWPGFIRALDDEAHYPRMAQGVWGSVLLTALLCGAIAIGQAIDAVSDGWLLYAVAGGKLVIDAGALLALRLKRYSLKSLGKK